MENLTTIENLSTKSQKEALGNRTLRLVILEPGTLADDAPMQHRVSREELIDNLVLGDGLANGERLLINGQDAISLLPRPDAFGNSRLALLDALDSTSPGSMMILEVDDQDHQVTAAD